MAGADARTTGRLRRFATALGLAFQIQDDVLNLSADEGAYGKEILGDLWEGKHTLILMHAFRSATKSERTRAKRILARARPLEDGAAGTLPATIEALFRAGELSAHAKQTLLAGASAERPVEKTAEDIAFLSTLITRYGSLDYARHVALRRARRATASLELLAREHVPSVHFDFLRAITQFVVERER